MKENLELYDVLDHGSIVVCNKAMDVLVTSDGNMFILWTGNFCDGWSQLDFTIIRGNKGLGVYAGLVIKGQLFLDEYVERKVS